MYKDLVKKKEYHRKWREKNREKILKYSSKWRAKNIDKARQCSKDWNKNNAERVKARKAIWRNTLRGRYSSLISNSKTFGRILELSFEEWSEIIKSNCFYCGGKTLSTLGGYCIDRIDSEKGYTKENSVACCDLCNQMKSNIKKDIFLKNIKKIYEHHINPF